MSFLLRFSRFSSSFLPTQPPPSQRPPPIPTSVPPELSNKKSEMSFKPPTIVRSRTEVGDSLLRSKPLAPPPTQQQPPLTVTTSDASVPYIEPPSPFLKHLVQKILMKFHLSLFNISIPLQEEEVII